MPVRCALTGNLEEGDRRPFLSGMRSRVLGGYLAVAALALLGYLLLPEHPGCRRPGRSASARRTSPRLRYWGKTTFKALRNVSLCPWKIGKIAAAALVLLPIDHDRTTLITQRTNPTRKAPQLTHPTAIAVCRTRHVIRIRDQGDAVARG